VSSDATVRKFIRQWRKRYPHPVPWIDNGANRQCRKSEARWLAPFEGRTLLKRREVVALVEWRFSEPLEEKERALRGVTGPFESGHARRCIKKALATTGALRALDCLLEESGGIPGWGPAMASAVLAACRPTIYAVADGRALSALRALGLTPPREDDEFVRGDWWPYLRTCRSLAASCDVSLRDVTQALRAAGSAAPSLPKSRTPRRHQKAA
jgi:hypothetical protein